MGHECGGVAFRGGGGVCVSEVTLARAKLSRGLCCVFLSATITRKAVRSFGSGLSGRMRQRRRTARLASTFTQHSELAAAAHIDAHAPQSMSCCTEQPSSQQRASAGNRYIGEP